MSRAAFITIADTAPRQTRARFMPRLRRHTSALARARMPRRLLSHATGDIFARDSLKRATTLPRRRRRPRPIEDVILPMRAASTSRKATIFDDRRHVSLIFIPIIAAGSISPHYQSARLPPFHGFTILIHAASPR